MVKTHYLQEVGTVFRHGECIVPELIYSRGLGLFVNDSDGGPNVITCSTSCDGPAYGSEFA